MMWANTTLSSTAVTTALIMSGTMHQIIITCATTNFDYKDYKGRKFISILIFLYDPIPSKGSDLQIRQYSENEAFTSYHICTRF